MAMAVTIKKSRALDGINLTPMIDMVFNLLIFFLVASQFAEEERELDVLLPTASEARPLISKPREMFVNIDREGRYVVERRVVTLNEVEGFLRQAVTDNPGNQSLYIRADRRVPFDYVVAVMNLSNKVGIRDYQVTTADAPAAPAATESP